MEAAIFTYPLKIQRNGEWVFQTRYNIYVRIHTCIHCTYSSQCDTFGESGDVPLTSEQARVVTHPIRKGETIKVIAFAGMYNTILSYIMQRIDSTSKDIKIFLYSCILGTGKTTTLVEFAKRNRNLSIGYCVYNRWFNKINGILYSRKNCQELNLSVR
jgi:hypothetical protein